MKVQGQVSRHAAYAARLRGMGESMLAPGTTSFGPATAEAGAAVGPIACLVLGSDRGLCGAFNTSLLAAVERFLVTHGPDRVRLSVAGRKLRQLLASKGLAVANDISGVLRDFSTARVSELADRLKSEFANGTISELWAIHTRFSSSTRQRVETARLLPLVAGEDQAGTGDVCTDCLFEPDRRSFTSALLAEQYVHGIIQVFLESMASEQMARMLAMDMATTNAGEMVQGLTRQLNKVRQEMINNELAEISSAAEVLRNAQ